jgi:hypothetical protein
MEWRSAQWKLKWRQSLIAVVYLALAQFQHMQKQRSIESRLAGRALRPQQNPQPRCSERPPRLGA